MNVREEEAALTATERLVYAAAFAIDCALVVRQTPSDTQSAKAAAWVAIMHLRADDHALKNTIDWRRVDEMYASFRMGE